jgi:hypothetical protein
MSNGCVSVYSHIPFFQRLANARTRKEHRSVVQSADRDSIIALVEVVTNTLCYNIPLTLPQRRKLRKYAGVLRALAKIRSEKKARRILEQHGGFAPSLLVPVLAELATGLASHFLSQK